MSTLSPNRSSTIDARDVSDLVRGAAHELAPSVSCRSLQSTSFFQLATAGLRATDVKVKAKQRDDGVRSWTPRRGRRQVPSSFGHQSDDASLAMCFYGAFQRQLWRTVWDTNRLSMAASSFAHGRESDNSHHGGSPPRSTSPSPSVGRTGYHVFASSWDYELEVAASPTVGAEKTSRTYERRFFTRGSPNDHVAEILRDDVFTATEERRRHPEEIIIIVKGPINEEKGHHQGVTRKPNVTSFVNVTFRSWVTSSHSALQGVWVQNHRGTASESCRTIACIVALARMGCVRAMVQKEVATAAGDSGDSRNHHRGILALLRYDFVLVSRGDSVLSIPLTVFQKDYAA